MLYFFTSLMIEYVIHILEIYHYFVEMGSLQYLINMSYNCFFSCKCDELCKQWRKNSHGSISFDGFLSRICLMGTRNVCGNILIMDNLILYLNMELTFINFSNTHKYNH